MLALLLTLTAQAEEPATTTNKRAEESAEAAEKPAPITIETISLTGEVAVPEVVFMAPRITTQESSVEVLEKLIDEKLEAEAKRR